MKKQKPISPFFIYREGVYKRFSRENPEKKPSELNSLIADSWNDLTIEEKSYYHKEYETQLGNYNEYLQKSALTDRSDNETNKFKRMIESHTEEIDSKSNEPKVSKESGCLTYISKKLVLYRKIVRYNEVAPEEIPLENHSLDFHNSWEDALTFIKREYHKHLDEYANKFNKYKWWERGTREFGWKFYVYEHIEERFHATIFDFRNSKKSDIFEGILRAELQKEIKRTPKHKKYLIINILKENGFHDRAIKDVISSLPEMKLTDDEVKLWEKKLKPKYCGRDYEKKPKARHDGDDSEVDDYGDDDGADDDSSKILQ